MNSELNKFEIDMIEYF